MKNQAMLKRKKLRISKVKDSREYRLVREWHKERRKRKIPKVRT